MTVPPAITPLLVGKRLLIFDFDGTLADSSPLHARAFAEVLAPLGVTVDYPQIAGLRTDAAIRQCLATAGLTAGEPQVAQLVRAKQARGRELIARELQAFPAASALLTALRGRIRMAMVTSGSRGTVEPALAKLGWAGWFDPLICGDEVGEAKPNPEGFLRALAITGVTPDEALVFEDSAAGFAAARAAGIAFVDAVAHFARA